MQNHFLILTSAEAMTRNCYPLSDLSVFFSKSFIGSDISIFFSILCLLHFLLKYWLGSCVYFLL